MTWLNYEQLQSQHCKVSVDNQMIIFCILKLSPNTLHMGSSHFTYSHVASSHFAYSHFTYTSKDATAILPTLKNLLIPILPTRKIIHIPILPTRKIIHIPISPTQFFFIFNPISSLYNEALQVHIYFSVWLSVFFHPCFQSNHKPLQWSITYT